MCRKFNCCWTAFAAVLFTAESLVGLSQIPSTAALPNVPASSPQFKPTSEQVGDSLMGHQRYQAAIEAYKNAPQGSAETWNKMGIAYQLMFNIGDATRCYRTALKLDSKNSIAVNNLASVYMEQKKYAAAERAYKRAIKLDPQSALFRKNMGTALLAEHKYQKGWEAYQAALALDPGIFTHTGNVRVENPANVQDRGAMNFYMAKGCVKAGMKDRAVEYLRLAMNEGFVDSKKIATDTEFDGIRDLPAFQQMLAAQESPERPDVSNVSSGTTAR